MDRNTRGVDQIRRGISRAALAQDAQIAKLQAELRDAYERELGMSSVVAERRQFSQELFTARLKLDMYRKKLSASEAEVASLRRSLTDRDVKLGDLSRSLAETQSKLTALSDSVLGALQLKYWRRRPGRGRGKA
jgi:chromosome segregation ATPase